MKKTLLKLTVLTLAALALTFTACEGPVGPAGDPGTNGGQGLPGGVGVMVYDSSSPPQLLGYLLSYPDRVLTPAGNIVPLLKSPTIIYFSGPVSAVSNTETPYTAESATKNTYYYNPYSGGTWFYYDGDPYVSLTASWRILADGTEAASTMSIISPLKWSTQTFADIVGGGFDGTIVMPLQYSTAVLP